MKNKHIIALLSIASLSLPLSGCTFVREVENNDPMGKALKVVYDDENEVEKLKTGNAEVQKAFDREKNKAERRERDKLRKEEKKDKEKDQKSFLFKWK